MIIYIICPQNRMSGGPELAHQLCNAINRLSNVPAYMCYANLDPPYNIAVDAPTPEIYKQYNTIPCTDIVEIDKLENVVVFPEGLTYSLSQIKHARKVMWWMSVDNYTKSTAEMNLPEIRDTVYMHLFQSYYSVDYVSRVLPGAKGIYLSDYINEEHGKFIYPAEFRQNIALYNPAKGLADIKPLIEKADWLKWVPLFKLDLAHMVLMMEAAKIYIDFGNHPGKDRIPREAAADGCCVITNKKGSAAFEKDVPIPEMYKFDDPAESLDEINSLMHDICDNFATHQNAFASYRDFIAGEKDQFDKDTLHFISELQA
jgi:hypothetical protein